MVWDMARSSAQPARAFESWEVIFILLNGKLLKARLKRQNYSQKKGLQKKKRRRNERTPWDTSQFFYKQLAVIFWVICNNYRQKVKRINYQVPAMAEAQEYKEDMIYPFIEPIFSWYDLTSSFQPFSMLLVSQF